MRLNVPAEEFFTDKLEPKIVQIQEFKGASGAQYSTPFDERMLVGNDVVLTISSTDFAKLRGSMYLKVTIEAISVEEAVKAEERR